MDSQRLISVSTVILEQLGVLVITFGVLIASAAAFVQVLRKKPSESIYEWYRRQVGRGILLGLELLVAADIIRTVAIRPTYQTVGVLAAVVLIRTFLSFTLEVEMTGFWPWQRNSDQQHKVHT